MKALKAFAYSHNGVDPIHLAAGDDASSPCSTALPRRSLLSPLGVRYFLTLPPSISEASS